MAGGMKDFLAGLRDFFEMLWNEERVLERNRDPELGRMPTPAELSYKR